MLRFVTLFVSFLHFLPGALAQGVTIETLLPAGSTIDDALVLGPDGALYGSRWGAAGGPGRTVTRVDLDDVSTSIYSDGLNRANGLGFDDEGYLYVANYGARTLERIAPDGVRTVYATVPTGNLSGVLVHPSTGVIYVTNYTDDTVGIATGDGAITPFLSNDGMAPELNGPVGMAVDDEGRLYVSNFNDGKIFRVDEDGEMTEIADLDGPPNATTGFIAYAGGALYATNIGRHIIERVSLADGSVETVAGTGTAGTTDGPGESAQFNGPNGIVASSAGEVLYVSDAYSRALRRIVLNTPTSQQVAEPSSRGALSLQAYPNPTSASVLLRFQVDIPGSVAVTLYDVTGRLVRRVEEQDRAMGEREVALNLQALPAGVYVVEVRVGLAREREKVVVIE